MYFLICYKIETYIYSQICNAARNCKIDYIFVDFYIKHEADKQRHTECCIRNEDDLYKQAMRVDWTEYFDVRKTFVLRLQMRRAAILNAGVGGQTLVTAAGDTLVIIYT